MSLPQVNVNFVKSSRGYSLAYADGCTGLLANGVAVSGKIGLEDPICVENLDDFVDKSGITKSATGANANVYKCVKEFYDEAPRGTVLWISLVAVGTSIDELCDNDEDYIRDLVEASDGSIRTLMVKVTDPANYEADVENDLDSCVYDAIAKAQESAETMTTELDAPLLIVLEGRHLHGDGSSLQDISLLNCNRVAVLIGDTVQGSTGAAVGLLCGRIAAIPVHRSIAKVADGTVGDSATMYIGAKAASRSVSTGINDKGFVCPRVFVGTEGFYWSDDKLATSLSDDYCSIARRRTIDKGKRILDIILLNRLNDEVAVSRSGLLNSAWVTGLETEIKSVIKETMGSAGNLGSVDETEDGVEVYIDLEQNVVETSAIEVEVSLMPYGYGRYITGTLRFELS